MKYIEKHPMIMILVGICGISLSAIFVRYSLAPSAVTAAWRLLWTVILMTPVVFGKGFSRREMAHLDKKARCSVRAAACFWPFILFCGLIPWA